MIPNAIPVTVLKMLAVFRQEPGTGIWLARNLNLIPGKYPSQGTPLGSSWNLEFLNLT
jgi:hypothetical protein